MKITKKIEVPTGHILVGAGKKSLLEFLSIGDYGKDVNLKSKVLGLNREIDRVEHQKMLPLEEKWVITISPQYGCSIGCTFCDVPRVGPSMNATKEDLINQVRCGMSIHPEVTWSNRLNIHFARMGEPTWNPAVLEAAEEYRSMLFPNFIVHPVVSTVMPRNHTWLRSFISHWMFVKNNIYEGNAGLQLSINSTDDDEREAMFRGNALSLEEIASVMRGLKPVGRKITLNFAIAGYEIDPAVLLRYFDPEYYICKLTPMHKTRTALKNGLETEGDYCTGEPYKEVEAALEKAGYDVLVFVASKEEDESRITCGNAVLAEGKQKS